MADRQMYRDGRRVSAILRDGVRIVRIYRDGRIVWQGENMVPLLALIQCAERGACVLSAGAAGVLRGAVRGAFGAPVQARAGPVTELAADVSGRSSEKALPDAGEAREMRELERMLSGAQGLASIERGIGGAAVVVSGTRGAKAIAMPYGEPVADAAARGRSDAETSAGVGAGNQTELHGKDAAAAACVPGYGLAEQVGGKAIHTASASLDIGAGQQSGIHWKDSMSAGCVLVWELAGQAGDELTPAASASLDLAMAGKTGASFRQTSAAENVLCFDAGAESGIRLASAAMAAGLGRGILAAVRAVSGSPGKADAVPGRSLGAAARAIISERAVRLNAVPGQGRRRGPARSCPPLRRLPWRRSSRGRFLPLPAVWGWL